MVMTFGASKVEIFIAVVPTAAPSGVATNPTTGLSAEPVDLEDVMVTLHPIGRTNIYRELSAVHGDATENCVLSKVIQE